MTGDRRKLAALAAAVFAAAGVAATVTAPAHAAPTGTAQSAATTTKYTAMGPIRVLDTRIGLGAPQAAVGQAGVVTLDLAARVPAGASSVVLTLTGTEPTASTFVTAYPTGGARPTVSNLNLLAGQTRPNSVTVTLGADRKVSLYNHSGSIQLIADLAGYYATDGAALFTSNNTRILDTRATSPLGPGGTIVVDLSAAVPASATAAAVNLTGVGATSATFLTAWPHGSDRPTASQLNPAPGGVAAAHAIVPVGPDRKIAVYNHAGNTHLVVDLQGFYTPAFGAAFTPVAPTRILDTRNGTGTANVFAVGPDSAIRVSPGDVLPVEALSAVINFTGTDLAGADSTFLTAGHFQSRDVVPYSTINPTVADTVANLAAVPVRNYVSPRAERFTVFNKAGLVQVIGDLAGYFTVPRTQCGQGCVSLWGSPEGHGTEGAYLATPKQMPSLSGVTAISARYAIGTGGSVYAWGANNFGQLGNGWFGSMSTVAVPVVGLDNIVAVASGAENGYAVRGDGTVWSWGRGRWLGLGDKGDTPFTAPVQVTALSGVRDIESRGSTVYALKTDGSVWAWGSNGLGQFGNGATQDSLVPVKVDALTGVREISAAFDAAIAIRADGSTVSWGSNMHARLGNGTVCDATTGANCVATKPTPIPSLSDVKSVSMGAFAAFAVKSDGTVWGWGENKSGRLGNGQECFSDCAVPTPQRTGSITTATAVVAAEFTGGIALLADGSVMSWGFFPTWSMLPRPVEGLADVSALAGSTNGLALIP